MNSINLQLKDEDLDSKDEITPKQIFMLIHNNFYVMNGSGEHFVLSKHDIQKFQQGKIKVLPQYKSERSQKLEAIRVLSRVLERPVDKYKNEIIRQWFKWLQNENYSSAKNYIGFYPKNDSSDVINLFPKEFKTVYKGDRKEVRSVWDHDFHFPHISEYYLKCMTNNEKSEYEYLMKTYAFRRQYPEKKPQVVFIFLGTMGTGKGTNAVILSELFGHIVEQISTIDLILQKHNQILINTFIIVIDEANFLVKPELFGRFKSYITDPTIDVEPKNQPPFSITSSHFFIINSNNARIMKEDKDGRRSVYFNTVKYAPDDEQKNKAFYKKLHSDEVFKKEIVEFAGFLDGLDVSDFDPTDRPKSLLYAEKKLDSLESLEKWLFDIADTGKANFFKEKSIECNLLGKTFFGTEKILQALNYLPEYKLYKPISAKQLAAKFKEFLNDPNAESKRKIIGNEFSTKKISGWEIPQITELRKIFIERYHLPNDYKWTLSNEELAEEYYEKK